MVKLSTKSGSYSNQRLPAVEAIIAAVTEAMIEA